MDFRALNRDSIAVFGPPFPRTGGRRAGGGVCRPGGLLPSGLCPALPGREGLPGQWHRPRLQEGHLRLPAGQVNPTAAPAAGQKPLYPLGTYAGGVRLRPSGSKLLVRIFVENRNTNGELGQIPKLPQAGICSFARNQQFPRCCHCGPMLRSSRSGVQFHPRSTHAVRSEPVGFCFVKCDVREALPRCFDHFSEHFFGMS